MSLRHFFQRKSEDAELSREIESYLQHEIDENVARGMSEQEARRRAQVKFGSRTRVREELWETNTVGMLEQVIRNVRYALRTLARAPGFTVAAVLVIALGIGSTTALFTIVRSVLLKPLPFEDPDHLIRLYEYSADAKFPYNNSAAGVFAGWKKQSRSFADMAILAGDWPYGLSGAGGQFPERVSGSQCSWNLFPLLGVEPTLGRNFTAEDDKPSANATVILSWGLWKRRFGGDPSILNQPIHLDEKTYTIIGVMPAWFAYPGPRVQLWTPIYHEQPAEEMQTLASHDFETVGRLKPGVSEGEARAELSVITRQLHDQHLDDPFVSIAANSRPLLEALVGDVKTPLYVLLAATGCLLLIACLNVGGLLVARGAARRRELAIRAALGGNRWQLLGGHLAESFLLAAGGGALGLTTASAAIQWFVATRQHMSRVEAIQMDGVVVLFAVGLTLLCAVFAGMMSALSIKGHNLLAALQESSRSHTIGHGQVLARKWLLAVEVALTVVLLIGAGLLLKSYARLRASNLGCLTDNVLTMDLTLPDAKYKQPAERMNFFETLLGRVRSLPGVEFAGLTTAVPGVGYGGDNGFAIAEHPPLPVGMDQYAMRRLVDPGYFEALGIPFLRGQDFDAAQRLDKADEVIVTSSFAKVYFGDEDPLGKHLKTLGDRPYRIVGVVGDTRWDIREPAQPMMYFPIYSGRENDGMLAVRSSRDVMSLALPIQQIIQQMDPELAVSRVLTMDQIIGNSTLDASFNATLVLAFAILSLVLAAVGLFGVLSYIVAQRTTEIGVRIALGAQRGEVLRLMLSDGLWPASVGLLLGLAGGIAASEKISDLLYGMQPLDASVFAGVALLLLLVAAAACLLPAWRASRLDPMQALRVE
jgi:predicted permease